MGATRADIQDYAVYRDYLNALGGDNTQARNRLIKNLRRAVLEELTPRQRQVVLMYFADGMKMTEVAAKLGVNVSTVSRTVKRGKLRLKKCLRYGARELLAEDAED